MHAMHGQLHMVTPLTLHRLHEAVATLHLFRGGGSLRSLCKWVFSRNRGGFGRWRVESGTGLDVNWLEYYVHGECVRMSLH